MATQQTFQEPDAGGAAQKKRPLLPGSSTIQPTVPTQTGGPFIQPPVPGGGVTATPGAIQPMGAGMAPAGGLQTSAYTPPKPPTMTVAGQTVTKNPIGGLGQGSPASGAPAGIQPVPGGVQPIGSGMMPEAMPVPGGVQPIGPGMMPGGGAPQTGGPFITPFGPGNDLRFQQINPAANDRLRGTQSAVDAAAGALSGGPNRQQLAQDLFADYIAQSQPDFDRSLRGITQRNAAGGRLGSGMYGSDLTDAATARTRDLGSFATRLAYDTAGGDIQDRLNNLGALSGLEGQQFGMGAAQRNELRGERGYQQGVAGQAQQDAIGQRLLEDQLLNSQWGRDYQRLGLLGSLGYGSNPASTLGGLAGDTQGAATQAGAGVNDLFMQWLLSQRQAGG